MRSLSVRLLLSFLILIVVPTAFAHDVTLNGTSSFAALDGSSSDHDGVTNGVFTVDDGNLVVNGAVNCNDDGAGNNSACSMAFAVSGNLSVNGGGALYAENRNASGTGGAITLTVGGNLALNGNAIVSSAAKTSSSGDGGAITANVTGNVTLSSNSTIDAGSAKATGGALTIAAGGVVSVGGNVLSGPSRTVLASKLTGAILDGGNPNQQGGTIIISSTTFVEPAISVASTANIVSQGEKNGAGPVTLDGCGVAINGLVAALSIKDSPATVVVRSGKAILVDGRDLGGAGTRRGRVRADALQDGANNDGVDLFARGSVTVLGPSGSLFAVSSVPGAKANKDGSGTIRVISLEDAVTASGNAFIAGADAKGTQGGTISIAAANDVNLDNATLVATGDHSKPKKQSAGGDIVARSYSGDVFWRNGVGDVRPVGSSADVPPADQGTIALTACATVDTTGSTFPANGVHTGVFPTANTGVCSPAAPSLPAGAPPLVTCNTPPVANDASATTNEDTTVTITLSGSDVDGDSLTFSIVSGPSNGTLGAIVSTGPTTATVDYTPNLNFNGSDSFVFQANDGNGGTDNATATITVNAVNDPPSFLAGPTVTVLEDSGAQTYANWASSISAGPADESGQTVSFTVTNDNNALFSVQPSVDSTGTLTFTPAANAYGSAAITIVAQDNGGTANGGNDTSAAQTSTINVNAVNDPPSFTAGGNVTVNEDSGAYSAAWASAISAGPNEGSQTVSFVVSNDNNALFASQPAVDGSGVLTFTLAANANGSATVSVYAMDDGGTANGGDDTSATQTFTISVGAVNDAPSFTSGGDVTVLEDSGAYSAPWAAAISAGPADESGQMVSFSVSNDNNALFAAQPSIDPSGTLSFILDPNTFGSATVTVTLSDNGGTANGGVDTSAPQTFALTVTAVNDEPSFIAGGDVTVNEDSGAYSAAWATGISAGPNEGAQTLTFVVTNDNNALFAAQPAIDASGVLTFTPAADANGSAIVTVYLMDDGGPANGGDDTSPSVTFTITVNSINDAPSFTSGGDVTVNEDSGAYSSAWATGISAGPANESGQSLTFNITGNSNPSLFASGPALDSAGVLSFALVANAFGSATITVTLSDNGGTASGGVDTSAPQSFTITVNAVNDAPSFTAGGNVTVNEDSGAYSAAWATAISAGQNEGGQTVAFNTSNDNNALFSVQPSIDAAGVLTFTPAPNAYGTATISVYAQDNGGTANGGVDTSATVNFVITVNGVNDPPTAGNDAWETEGNTELRVDNIPSILPYVGDTTTSGTGVRDNDADTVEGDPFLVTGVVGCADTTAPFDCAVTGGTLSLADTGYFSFKPAPGATSASFQYVITDQPSSGAPASATGTVTITIHDMIWYVNGSAPAGGNGTSSAPFNDFTSLNGLGDVDGPGDYIFVHSSNVTGSIALEASQKLWGQGIGLVIPRNLNGNGFPTTLAGAFSRPNVSSTGDTVSVTAVTGVEIAGLNLSSSAGNAIDVTSAPFGAAASASIYSNEVLSAALEGIDVNGFSASGTSVSIDTTSVTSNGNGVDVLGADGTVVFSYSNGTIHSVSGNGLVVDGTTADTLVINGLSNVTISGNTAGNGVSITAARFDANAGTAAFDTVTAGALNVGASGNPVGGYAVAMNNVSGDLAFSALNAYASTSGVTIAGSGLFTGAAGMRVSNGGGAISASAGVGLSVTNSTIGAADLNFTSISAANAPMGIVLLDTGSVGGLTVTGVGVTAGSGGTIQNTSARGASFINAAQIALSNMNFTNAATANGAPCSALSLGNNAGCNAAIHLDGVSGVALDRLVVNGSMQQGINGRNVTGFSLANSTLTAIGNEPDENGLNFYNLLGTSSIAGTSISGSFDDNVDIQNNSGTGTVTVTSSQFDNASFGSGFLFGARGTAVLAVDISGSTLNDNFSGAIPAVAADSASLDLKVSGCTITGNNDGISIGTSQSANATFDIFNNANISANDFVAISVFQANPSAGVLQGKIRSNAISVPNGRPTDAILVNKTGDGTAIVSITDNTLSYAGTQRAILVQAGDGNGPLDTTVTGNSIDIQLDGAGNAVAGVLAQASFTGGNTPALCLDLGGAAFLSNTFTHSLGGVIPAGDIRVRQRNTGTVRLPGYAGAPTDTTAVVTYLSGRNTVVSNPTATFDSTGFAGGASCSQPVVP
ncbi:MAG: tandem-95 repeat protein [Thermoanaerobaculia bacterium]